MKPTKRTHFNPCFWTAHWNPDYFELARNGKADDPRHQRVYSLNVISNKILHPNVENVHFENGLGIAEATPELIKGYIKKYNPDKYEECAKHMDAIPGATGTLDFETVLNEMESKDSYRRVIEVIRRKKGTIRSVQDRIEIGIFLTFQMLRSHAYMNTRFKWAEKDGIPKFEEMMILSHYLGDLTFMVNWTMKLTMGRWYFYCVEEDMFPLTDSPILVQPDNVMAALSPRLLLEIDRSDHSNESGWSTANFIKPQKLDEFRRRTIENTHREIIFGHRPLLEQWQSTAEFARQHEAVVNSRKKDKGVA